MSSERAAGADVPVEARKSSTVFAWPAPRAELLALVSILLGAIAQLILKGSLLQWSAHHTDFRLEPAALLSLAGVPFGLLVYATGTLFWWKAVRRASISYLYPLSASSYALVALGGQFFFRESIQSGRWIGIGVITLGVALLALSNLRGGE